MAHVQRLLRTVLGKNHSPAVSYAIEFTLGEIACAMFKSKKTGNRQICKALLCRKARSQSCDYRRRVVARDFYYCLSKRDFKNVWPNMSTASGSKAPAITLNSFSLLGFERIVLSSRSNVPRRLFPEQHRVRPFVLRWGHVSKSASDLSKPGFSLL